MTCIRCARHQLPRCQATKRRLPTLCGHSSSCTSRDRRLCFGRCRGIPSSSFRRYCHLTLLSHQQQPTHQSPKAQSCCLLASRHLVRLSHSLAHRASLSGSWLAVSFSSLCPLCLSKNKRQRFVCARHIRFACPLLAVSHLSNDRLLKDCC